MADTFPACLAVTLVYEGGKANNPADPGGKTNKGITQATYTKWLAAKGQASRDVFAITDAEVESIYRGAYWNVANCGLLPPGLDLMHFDAAVNSGPGQAAKWLAKAKLAGAATPAQVTAYADARLSFLHALRTWSVFGKGWTSRVADVEAKALRMAVGGQGGPSAVITAAAKQQASTASVAAKVKTGAVAVGSATASASVVATITAAHAHPAVAGGVALMSFLGWLWGAFTSHGAGARAAVLSSAAKE